MKDFEIPVVLFLFKRFEKPVQIIGQIAKVKPKKIYLLGDGPRDKGEFDAVKMCRDNVEAAITWDCEVIKNYSQGNRGVYNNIGEGARWVFQRESKAIFLEDDNYPEESFFEYCRELLERYENDNRILWICGTNYLGEYNPDDGADYMFTKLMLPCGWASWSDKFLRFYDGHMETYKYSYIRKRIKALYMNKKLYYFNKKGWDKVVYAWEHHKLPNSWDYQMAYALRANNLFGIAPKYNQIRNIGADVDSIHGGTSLSNIMTSRFCEVQTRKLSFPLNHPNSLLVDPLFEKKMEDIIVPPFYLRLKSYIGYIIKFLLDIPQEEALSFQSVKSKRLRHH